jgi:phosphatidylinositol alpha-mannosyltransferase
MRIAIVSDYYYPQLGGITEHVHGQATELTRRGHEVTVIAPRLVHVPRIVDGDDVPERTFELTHVGRAFPFYMNGSETLISLWPRMGAELDRMFASRSFDVVHIHNPWGVALPLTASRRDVAAVTVGTLHSVVPEGYRALRLGRRPAEWLLRRLDARIAVSDAVIESVGRFFPDLDFRTIPNGIDTDFFSPSAPPIDPVTDKKTIVFVGRFDPRNGVKTMIQAFATLRRTRDDVRLVVVGDGPLRPIVMRLVPDELVDDVVFAGRVNRRRPGYLASADVLCTPCSLASFGMVLLEGMSAGLPIVASRLPGFELVMRDGIDGVMVERPHDEAGFAAELDRMLDDPERARQMGAAGRERAVTTFSWRIVGGVLESLYEELVEARSRRPPLDRAA